MGSLGLGLRLKAKVFGFGLEIYVLDALVLTVLSKEIFIVFFQ